jgi:hypothetical protein
MIFTSGSSRAVCCSKVAREMPRRAASGHMPSMQFLKSATAARIASGCISGWPDAPGCPLQPSLLRRDGTGRGDLRKGKAVILRECRA